jgi:hypothetical protein
MSDVLGEVRPDQRRSAVASVRSELLKRSVAVGVVAGVVTFVLRHAGLLVGPWAIAVVVLCFIFSPGPRRVSDRFILLFAVAAGFLPLVGWVPGLELKADVPGAFLAVSVGIVCGYQLREGRVGARSVARPVAGEILAFVVGAAVTWWWARPWSRLGLSSTLSNLMRGYDNNSHFAIFSQNLRLGSFVQVRPTLPSGADRVGYDYPQGMHQAWAQVIRLLVPRPPSGLPWLIHSYLDMLLVTCCAIVLLGCMAAVRLCNRDLLTALPAMAVVVALFAFGRFQPFTGFMNYELAICACAVAVSLMVRPTLDPRYNFLAVAGLGLIVVYNWYPLFLMMAPAVVVATLRARAATGGKARHGLSAFIVATAVAYVLPAVFFLHRGTSTLNEVGSGISPSWGLLIISVVALFGVAAYRHSSNPDLTTNAILGAPAVLGAAGVIVLAAYEYASVGDVAYYGQKFAAGVLGICLVVLACVVAGDVATTRVRRHLSMPMSVALSVLVAAAALQIDGYVGPLTGVLQSTYDAAGITEQHDVQIAPTRSVPAEELLLSAQDARSSGADDGVGQWWYIGVAPTSYNPKKTDFVRLALWFSDLAGDATNAGYFRAQDLGKKLDRVHSPTATARIVIQDFPNPMENKFHLFVPTWLETAMVQEDPIWGSSGLLLPIPSVSPSQATWPD